MLLQSKNFIIRTSLGWKKLKQSGLGGTTGLFCSTKQIISAFRTRLTAAGVTVGSTKCISSYVNNLTGATRVECIVTAFELRLQALGVVTGPSNCLTNYVNNLIGENTNPLVVATWSTMEENWDTIDYEWNQEWYQPII